MITLELINPQNALVSEEVRLRALQDTPTAFSSTYAKEVSQPTATW